MLPNEVFALACRERYAEDGLVVDESNGEFAHCPLPKSMGDTGYYLLHDDHQWQGLLQSKDTGRRCYYTYETQRWLMKANFVTGYFDLWDIYDEYNKLSEEHNRKCSEARKGVPRKPFSEEHKRKIGEASKGRIPTEETKRKRSETMKGVPKSEETRRRMSKARNGGLVKAIIATKPCGGELRYESVTEAQRELNTNNIHKKLTPNKIVTRGKFKGWHFRYA